MSKLAGKSESLWRVGLLFLIVGSSAVYLDLVINLIFILNHTVLDVVPSPGSWEVLDIILYSAIPGLGIPAIIGMLIGFRRFLEWKSIISLKLSLLLYLIAAVAINASFFLGGGWYAGAIIANIGSAALLFSIFLVNQEKKSETSDSDRKDLMEKSGDRGIFMRGILGQKRKQTTILAIFLLIGVFMSALIPFIVNLTSIPASLMDTATEPSSAAPNHENTFYILPIWEGVSFDVDEDVAELKYMERIVGGTEYTGNGFIKIGRSVSCWYTNSLLPSGSFDNTSLVHKLNVSAESNTPILFHMNGGNWGQCCSDHPVILAMRQNKSNCQWDQTGYCHPIGYNPGPNDRFWSFWPNSDWERFRERNIKQALEVIYDWWLENPDLLVGFSTDSEIHLNYHDFNDENKARTGNAYRSYFDYNNGTIEQYRYWASSNWTLSAFNNLCGTNFPAWDDVDAPRSPSVVGNVGHSWWETWTDFRIWHVKEAGKRQCKWINQSGFPRDMIWNHQILSEPDSEEARYVRADPLETAINPYCKVGVTRYGWISPKVWHSLGELALEETDDTLPSWGIFEWNLWHQHEYWAYREMLNCIYQYGGHVICPNEWVNCSINEGLWIPGIPEDECPCNDEEYNETWCCCEEWDGGECVDWTARHGNPQFLAALRDFVEAGQDYERGKCPDLRVNALDVMFYDSYYNQFEFFNSDGLYVMGGLLLLNLVYVLVLIGRSRCALLDDRKL